MAITRSFRLERDQFTAHVAPAAKPSKRCKASIRLDGTTYGCAREHHDGAHDALVKHPIDSGWVRW